MYVCGMEVGVGRGSVCFECPGIDYITFYQAGAVEEGRAMMYYV